MMEFLYFGLYTAVALALLTWGGNWACKLLLASSRLNRAIEAHSSAPATSPPAMLDPKVGRLIGSLERLLIAIGLAARSWEIVAVVIALKTVARFKELDERLHAEYFLVGSLFSILWALGVTLAWVAFDRCVGAGFTASLFANG